jgi:hypothetical protein
LVEVKVGAVLKQDLVESVSEETVLAVEVWAGIWTENRAISARLIVPDCYLHVCAASILGYSGKGSCRYCSQDFSMFRFSKLMKTQVGFWLDCHCCWLQFAHQVGWSKHQGERQLEHQVFR